MKASAKYAAFISYAHADEAFASRIQNALETYRLPKSFDASAREKLKPVFRDVTELTAHHSLSEKIRDAVKTSRFLIVLCSPAAKNSHWVNEEIQLFRKLHGENKILSVIIEGKPDTAFPSALTEGGREPLAANMTSREGFRFGITQLAASMIGVGLDELIQRDNKRRRFRLKMIMSASLAFSALMGGMAWTAIDARHGAETSRNEAEKLVEFLITDLKNELQTLGRTSILNDLGKRITEYYDAIPLSDMDRDRLARQAETRHLLSQVALDQGDLERAESEALAAFNVTAEILRRNPEDTDAIYDHAQSTYWVGLFHKHVKEYETALNYWKLYRQYGHDLMSRDTKNPKWIMEAAWGENNVANLHSILKDYQSARVYFEQSVKLFEEALIYSDNKSLVMSETAKALSGLSKAEVKLDSLNDALVSRTESIAILEKLKKIHPQNITYEYEHLLVSMELYLLDLIAKPENCVYEETLSNLNKFKPHFKNDPQNETYRNDSTHFRYHFFKACITQYSQEIKLREAMQLKPLIETSSLRNKTQFMGFVSKISIEQPNQQLK